MWLFLLIILVKICLMTYSVDEAVRISSFSYVGENAKCSLYKREFGNIQQNYILICALTHQPAFRYLFQGYTSKNMKRHTLVKKQNKKCHEKTRQFTARLYQQKTGNNSNIHQEVANWIKLWYITQWSSLQLWRNLKRILLRTRSKTGEVCIVCYHLSYKWII